MIVTRTHHSPYGKVTVAEKYPAAGNLVEVDPDEGQITEQIAESEQPNAGIDHGGLIGLGDDDHTQYHTDARAATWLAANHETTYIHTDIALNTTFRQTAILNIICNDDKVVCHGNEVVSL